MKCPNCACEVDDATAECPRCQLIFAKWKAAGTAAAPIPASPARTGGHSVDLRLWLGLLFAVAGFYWSGSGSATAQPSDHRLNSASCAFSGEVLDIYDLSPIHGARISFGPKAAAVTDAQGRYWVRVKPGVPLETSLGHPAYAPEIIQGYGRDWRDASFEQRVRAARQAAAENAPPPDAASCDPGQERVLNFALAPKDLSDEQQAKVAQVQ